MRRECDDLTRRVCVDYLAVFVDRGVLAGFEMSFGVGVMVAASLAMSKSERGARGVYRVMTPSRLAIIFSNAGLSVFKALRVSSVCKASAFLPC